MAITGNIGGFQYKITTPADDKKKQAAETTKRVADANALAAAQAAAAAQSAQAAQRAATTTPKTNATNSTAVQQQHLQNKINAGVVSAPTAKQQAVNNVTPATTTKSTTNSKMSNVDYKAQSANTPTVSIVNDNTPAATTTTSGGGGGGTPVVEATPTASATPTVTYDSSPSYSSGGYSSGNSGYSYPATSYSANYVEPAKAKFTPSEKYYQAMTEMEELWDKLKGGRTSYTDKVTSQLTKIENRDPFTYDYKTDTLFQAQLADSMRYGQLAMEDTIGQAAALTGGYGSTYAQKVGNQTYNQYVQDAFANLPDYYNMALDKYNSDLANDYNLLNQYRYADETEYERAYNDWKNMYTMANDQYAKEYENYWQEQGFNEDSRRWASEFNDSMDRFKESIRQHDNDFYEKIREYDTDDAFRKERAVRSDYEWDTSFDYQKERDGVSDSQWQKNYDYKVSNGSSSSNSSSANTGTTGYASKTFSSSEESKIKNIIQDKGIDSSNADALYRSLISQGYDRDYILDTFAQYETAKEDNKTLGTDRKIYNNGQVVMADLQGAVGVPERATFYLWEKKNDPANDQYYCPETGQTYPYAYLYSIYGDSLENHIVNGGAK